jgi:glycosyltransferase involved in cell wall biosynthesis
VNAVRTVKDMRTVKAVRTVDVVVPDGVDDPRWPSGGNTYDLRLCDGLAERGWSVRMRPVAGHWPWAGDIGRRALDEALGTMPDDAVALVDGLVSSAFPQVMLPASRRLRLVVLMHMPLGLEPLGLEASDADARARESGVLRAASAVVTPSAWCRRWLVDAYGVDPARVHVAPPGVDPVGPGAGTDDRGGSLLCVGAVTPAKGHDVLLSALARVSDLEWRCVCVGAVTTAPEFVATMRAGIRGAGLDDRLVLAGARTGRELATAYAAADVLVHPSRAETYGMVVTEALARGLPVLAARVGGIPEALGLTADGRLPGLLVPPGDFTGLAVALRRWLCDSGLRGSLRDAARRRRTELTGWPETADQVARVLEEVSA